MKKLFALLFAALLACCFASAVAESPLTVDELTNFWDSLLSSALEQEAVEPEEDEEGLFVFEFDQITLVTPDETLSKDSRVRYAELRGGMESLTDGREIGPGSALSELLAAYPMDNVNLSGSYDE